MNLISVSYYVLFWLWVILFVLIQHIPQHIFCFYREPENHVFHLITVRLKHVFHLITDRLNFGAMQMWFSENPPDKAIIHEC